MKTKGKFITAILTVAATAILFASCEDPKPADTDNPVDTVNVHQPGDTIVRTAPVDTISNPVDTTKQTQNDKADENKK